MERGQELTGLGYGEWGDAALAGFALTVRDISQLRSPLSDRAPHYTYWYQNDQKRPAHGGAGQAETHVRILGNDLEELAGCHFGFAANEG